jgi:hypothetical protein
MARFPEFVRRHLARIAANEVAFVSFAVALHHQAASRPESRVPGSLVDRRGPVVRACAQASKSASR